MQIVLPTWLGSFYGADFDFHTYETITLNKFEPHLGNQVRFLNTRWFDYTRLHPLQATYFFVACYCKISNQLSKKYFGVESRGIRYQDFTESRECGSFWNLRSFCDNYGFPYPWFIYQMMEYLLVSGRFKNRLPRPQHFLSNIDEEMAALSDVWANRVNGEILYSSSDPQFLVSNWVGSPTQIRHEDFLVNQINQKRVKMYAINDLVYEKQVLRVERAIKEWRTDLELAIGVNVSKNIDSYDSI